MVRRFKHALALAALAMPSLAMAQQSTWTNAGSGNWNVPGNWDVLPASSSTTQLLFGGNGNYTATNNFAGTFSLSGLTFSNANPVTLNGNAISLDGVPIIDVQGTSVATVANNIGGSALIFNNGSGTLILTGNNTFSGGMTIIGGRVQIGNGGTTGTLGANNAAPLITTVTGSTLAFNRTDDVTYAQTFFGAGTFEINSGIVRVNGNSTGFTGNVVVNGGTFRIEATAGTSNFNATDITVNNGGTFVFGNATVNNPNIPNDTYVTANTGGMVRWEEGEDFGGFHLKGGTINLTQGNMNIAGTTASTLESGLVTGAGSFTVGAGGVVNKITAGTVTVDNVNFVNTGALNIQEGTLITNRGFTGTGIMSLGGLANSATLRFNGPSASNARPLTVNLGGGTVDVFNASSTYSQTGALTLNGNLTKEGPGAYTITGATAGAGSYVNNAGNTTFSNVLGHTGNTTVNTGTVFVSPNATASSSLLDVANGANLVVNSGTGANSFTTTGLSLAASGGSNLQFDLNTTVNPTAPLMVLTDSLNLNGGTHTLRINNQLSLGLGSFTAIDYTGGAVSSGFNLVLPGRTGGSLVYDTANTQINVNITDTGALKWGGQVNSTWDVGTAPNVGGTNNWRLVDSNTTTNFINTDVIRFDDSANSFNVNVAGTVLPSGVLFNNAANTYTISGSGGIGGTTPLTKQGAGTVNLQTVNTYTGGTLVQDGILAINNGGSIGGTATVAGGTLQVNNGTIAGPAIVNSGLLQIDNGSISGAVTVNGGAFQVGDNATLGGNVAVNAAGTMRFNGTGSSTYGQTFSGTGNFEINSGIVIVNGNSTGYTGNVVINGGTFRVEATAATSNFNATDITVNTGGTFVFGNATINDPNIPNTTYITANSGGTIRWEEPETFGGFNLKGGTINLAQGGMTLAGATDSTLESGLVTGTVGNNIGGTLGVNKLTSGTVTVENVNFTNTGALNIQAGTLSTNVGFTGTGVMSIGTADNSATLQFNGTTATNARPLTINAAGGTVDVLNSGANYSQSGAVALNGILTKEGAGNYIITAATSGSGSAVVNNGQLNFTGVVGHTGTTTANSSASVRVNPNATPSSSAFVIANNASLQVNSDAGTSTFTAPGLSLAASGGSTLQFDLNTASLPTAPLMNISGINGLNLTGGTHTLRVNNVQSFGIGTFTAIDYFGTAINSGFNLALPGRTAGTIVYDTANTQINVNITGTDTIRWGGQVNGTWDVGTSANVGGTNNWRLNSNNANTNFIQTDTITFDDSATGNFNITVPNQVLPTAVTFNNSTSTYAFSGAGGIGGSTAVVKQGTGTVTFNNANTYTGATTINEGALDLGTGGSVASSIAVGATGTLEFNRTDTVSFGNSISGIGNILKNGTGSVTLTANNNAFTGTITINGGTFAIEDTGAGGDIGATSIVVNNTGTFHFVGPNGNPDLPPTTYITANPGGTAIFTEGEDLGGINLQGGALQLNNANFGLTGANASILQSGTIASLGGTSSISGAGGFNKTTAGTVSVTGVALNNNGAQAIDEGTLETDSGIAGTGVLSLGTASTSATLRLTGTSAQTYSKGITLNNTSVNGSRIDVSNAAAVITWSGTVNGTGQLTKSGAGTLVLGAAAGNTYAGGTTINEGTLVVNNTSGSGTGTGPVVINTGGALSGSGAISGSLQVNGGTISPGNSPGILTINGDVTLSSTSTLFIELNGTTAGSSYDQLLVNGQVNLGNASLTGSLGFTPAEGDLFFILNNDGSDPIVGLLAGVSQGSSVNLGGSNFLVSYSGDTSSGTFLGGNDLTLQFISAVPEPSTWALIVVTGAGAGWYYRRQRSKPAVSAGRNRRS